MAPYFCWPWIVRRGAARWGISCDLKVRVGHCKICRSENLMSTNSITWKRPILESEVYSKAPPAVIYHYTSQAGLMGIVAEKAIWATNIHCLNDSREFGLLLA